MVPAPSAPAREMGWAVSPALPVFWARSSLSTSHRPMLPLFLLRLASGMAFPRLFPRLVKRKHQSVTFTWRSARFTRTLLSEFSQSDHVVPGTQMGHMPGAQCPSVPLWSLLTFWAASFQTPGGLWVSLPTGQGSFLLSPFLQHLFILHASWGSHVFWVSRAVIYLQPGSHPVAVPRKLVLPGVSPQGVIIVCHCTVLCPRGPSEASGGSVTQSLPASQRPHLLTESGDAPWARGVWVSFPRLLELCLPGPESAQRARCCLCVSPRGVALDFRLGLQAARGVPVDSRPSGRPWSLVECCPWVACIDVLWWARQYGVPARGLSEVGGGREAEAGPWGPGG